MKVFILAILFCAAANAFVQMPESWSAPSKAVNAGAAMRETHAMAVEAFGKVREFTTKLSQDNFAAQADAATCRATVIAAWREFLQNGEDTGIAGEPVNTADGQCVALRSLFETNWETVDAATVEADVTAHCETSGCTTALQDHLIKIRQDCRGFGAWDTATRDGWKFVARIHRLVCMRTAEDGFCWPKFIGMVREMEALNTQYNHDIPADKLPNDRICTRCNMRIFRRVMTWADVEAGKHLVLRIVCMKAWTGNYCTKELYDVGKAFDNARSVDAFKNAFRKLCRTRCFHRVVRLLLNSPFWVPDTPTAREDMRKIRNLLVCARHSSGELCLFRIVRLIATLESNAANGVTDPCAGQVDAGTCTDACKKGIKDADLGCCAAQLFRIMDVADPAEGTKVRNWYVNTCGVNVGEICKMQHAKAVIVYRNLVRAWVEANRQAFEDAIRKDVAQAAGVDPQDVVVDIVTFTDINQADGTVTHFVAVHVTINSQNGGVTNVVRLMWKRRNFPTNNVQAPATANGAAASTDPTESVSIDESQSSISGDERSEEDEGLSSGAKAGIGLAVVAIIAVIAAIVGFVIYKKKKNSSSGGAPAKMEENEMALA